MADRDIEKLLAEVENTVTGKSARAAESSRRPVRSFTASLSARTGTAVAAGVVAAALVFVLFALLPFFGAFSGAAGAFLATFVSVFLLARRS